MRKIVILFLILTPALFSHGTEYSISENVVKIRAGFDTGLPFSNADVLVFPPGKSESEFKLKTDIDGVFYFEPDRTGTWVMQVRGDEGHGVRINFDVDENGLTDGKGGNVTTLQKIIMVLCVGWGAAGTALYFRKGRE